MKITKTILILLLSTVMFAAYADKPKKQDPLLTGPFFIQPYFNAFGMWVEDVDTTEARRGCVDLWEHQSARAYYFVSKKMPKPQWSTQRENQVFESIISNFMCTENILLLKKQ